MGVVLGVVLAAGAGRRMGGPKADLVVDGRRLVDRAVEALTAGGCDGVVAVGRPGLVVPGVRVLINPDPDRGLRSSLEVALAGAAGADALAVLLVDTPGIGPAAVRPVVEHWRTTGRISVAGYGGRRGHPTVMTPDQWRDALASAAADEGARAYLQRHAGLVDDVPVDGDPLDLDRPGDLTAWLGRTGPQRQRRPASGP